MKKCFCALLTLLLITACHESLADRAERDAKDYTERFCPTPIVNDTRTDSVTFDKSTLTYTYYCSFFNTYDDSAMVAENHDALKASLLQTLKDNTAFKQLKEAKFRFHYIVNSSSNPEKVLFDEIFTEEQYN